MSIDFSQFKDGELVKCHHSDYFPVEWFYGTFHEDKDYNSQVYATSKRYYVENKAKKKYYYGGENMYNYEIKKVSNAEKIIVDIEI